MSQAQGNASSTPGPWWMTDSGVRSVEGYICHTNSATHYPGQDERYERETAERAANARLIAFAPDLLGALREVLASWLTEMPPAEAGTEAQNAWADRMAAARNEAAAVIAAATGAAA